MWKWIAIAVIGAIVLVVAWPLLFPKESPIALSSGIGTKPPAAYK